MRNKGNKYSYLLLCIIIKSVLESQKALSRWPPPRLE